MSALLPLGARQGSVLRVPIIIQSMILLLEFVVCAGRSRVSRLPLSVSMSHHCDSHSSLSRARAVGKRNNLTKLMLVQSREDET